MLNNDNPNLIVESCFRASRAGNGSVYVVSGDGSSLIGIRDGSSGDVVAVGIENEYRQILVEVNRTIRSRGW